MLPPIVRWLERSRAHESTRDETAARLETFFEFLDPLIARSCRCCGRRAIQELRARGRPDPDRLVATGQNWQAYELRERVHVAEDARTAGCRQHSSPRFLFRAGKPPFPVFPLTDQAPFSFGTIRTLFLVARMEKVMYTRRMTAQIIPFPARPAAMPMPAIDAWLEEIDDLGPEPPAFAAEMLLARAPEPEHPVVAWLRGFVRLPASEAS